MNIQRIDIDASNYGGVNKGRLFIVVHANGGSAQGTASWFKNPNADVSYHYLVCKDGTIMHFVDEGQRAWHAGVSEWEAYRNLNDWSVGVSIESLEGTHSEVTDAQYQALLELIRDIQARHGIETRYVRAHKEVSPGRKSDPVHIDMDSLRQDLASTTDSQETQKDTFDTLVLHGFHNLEFEEGKVIVRGNMHLNQRGDKVDIRLVD